MKVDHQKVCSTKVAEEPHDSQSNPGWLETAPEGFVGGYTRRVIPVPIPNTVVKPAGPMILLQRESRSLPALNRTPVFARRSGFFFCAYFRVRGFTNSQLVASLQPRNDLTPKG